MRLLGPGSDCLPKQKGKRKKSRSLAQNPPQITSSSALSSPTRSLAFSLSLISLSNCYKMDKRTAESPMDFEWQSRAPGDVTSPFYQLSMQHDNQKKRA